MPFALTNCAPIPTKSLPDVRNFFRNTVSPLGRQTISQFLLDAEIELKACQAEINRLRTAIHLLELKKFNLNTSMNKCRSLLSPVHRLPLEVLTSVFAFSCEVNTLEPSSLPSAIRIAMVCGRWRDAVLSSPILWSSLEIPFGLWKEKLDILTRLTVLYIDRSKIHPLTLEISFPNEHYYPEPSAVIHALSRSCSRWRHLTISIPETFTRPELLFPTLRGAALPLLESFHLIARPAFNQFGLVTIERIFGACPSLRNLWMAGSVAQPRLCLPLPQMTRVTLEAAFTRAAMSLLGRMPRLRELSLSFIVKQDGAEVQHVLSSTIETLSLSAGLQEDLDDVFQHLTTPSLKTLTISSYVNWRRTLFRTWPSWHGSVVPDFLERSGCSITSLCLESLPMTDTQTISLMKLVPTLTSLRIEELDLSRAGPNRIVTATFLRQFIVDQESHRIGHPGTTFLPLLTDLTLKIKAQGLFEAGLFVAVASRWVPDATRARDIGVECLRFVDITVVGSGLDSDSALKSLRCFRDAGLRLNVVCRSMTGGDSGIISSGGPPVFE
ncbi:hypothetical protein PQX77_016151 [Marasmius sp. AFHP31]|nr:hypothetical protein PQX77_016151 [Marasmius sp. AFHP31]